MNRSLTSVLRFVLDECIPPLVRDSRWFMWPLSYFWFRGKNIRQLMEFKSAVWTMEPEEYDAVYKNLSCRANHRPTDLSTPSLDHIISQLDPSARTLLDVGCGRGFFLNHLDHSGIKLEAYGTDVYETVELDAAKYKQGRVESLPFSDHSFDIVVCTHTLEHIVEIDRAIAELKRVCKKQLIVVVPCQREYRYTLDLHVHFFRNPGKIERWINLPRHHCRKILGDWVYVGWMSPCPAGAANVDFSRQSAMERCKS